MKTKIECAFSGVISFGRIWRKVPERDARSVWRWGVGRKSGGGGGGADFCIKMGNYESHFNISFIVKGKVTRQRL